MFRINSKVEDKTAPIAERIQPPVEQWLRGFHDAEFVVTDSFHACVFSILFHKPFFVVGNKKRGLSRFTSLLGLFRLENRLISTAAETDSLETAIPWNNIETTLNILRQKSTDVII